MRSISMEFILAFSCVLLGLTAGQFNLIILHTNDVHSRIEQATPRGGQCSDSEAEAGQCYGGVARAYTYIQQIRASNQHVLLLDAGDQLTGTIWFKYYKGAACKHFMQRLGYDAMALGNHEFDLGTRTLGTFLENISFPVLSANLDTSNDPFMSDLVQPSVILDMNGTKVGIVGYIYEDTTRLWAVDVAKTMKVNDLRSSVEAEVASMKQAGVQIIIALGHQGYPKDIKMAETLQDVDLVIGGHDHALLYTGNPPSDDVPLGEYPTVVTQTSGRKVLVVHSGQYGKYLGLLNLTFDEMGDVASWTGNPILLDSDVPQDGQLNAEVNIWKVAVENMAKEVAGQTRVLIDAESHHCRTSECNAGNFLMDALRYEVLRRSALDNTSWAESTIALINSGAVQRSLPPGDITEGDIMVMLPYANVVEWIQLKGQYLVEGLEHSVSEYSLENPPGRFFQFSGLRVKYDVTRPKGRRVREVKVLCSECSIPKYEALNNDTIYSVLTTTYIASGGDGFTMMADNLVKRFLVKRDRIGNVTLQDLVISHLNSRSPVVPGLDGRIQFVNDTPTCPTPECPTCPSMKTPTCPPQEASAHACSPLPLLMSVVTVLITIVLQNTAR